MIPLHQSEKTHRRGFVVNHLAQLNEYDFTEPHRHDYFEFFFFKKGGGVHYIDFLPFEIQDNSVHIVAPGQVHQMKRELDSEGHVILFEMSALMPPQAIEQFLFEHICLDAGELEPVFHLPLEQKADLDQRMERMAIYAKSNSDMDKLRIASELQLFCLSCMEQAEFKAEALNSEYMHFRRILKENYKTLKKVKEYAEILHKTERSLNDLVKQHAGKSASEVIYDQIIMEAKRLLRTGISVKEAAYALNFEDPAHFSKFFKSQTGTSPSDFQNYT